ncbi:hypothetical protein DPMN_115846 [Dreissena polymorpha]|uniref:Uncharacterized protein n=1 Tax=Dreissena polymorpha TaxID=45954 RepID=A0A9D4KMQ8_DREPO|nr:hypothetical protein DPMN_115846 [Dreissena polymorpha]
MYFKGLEAELKGRDIAVIGTNAAVNKLEVHHVTMLHDLRGRIVRCDTAIGKHSKDIGLLLGEIRRLEAMIYGLREKMNGDIHRLEAEVTISRGANQGVFYGNFGADIRPHSPQKRVYIFPLFCRKNPLQK